MTPVLLMTRPQRASERFLKALDDKGLPVAGAVISPAIAIDPKGSLLNTAQWDAVIFTSRHAVDQTEMTSGQTAFCVGDRTAKEAKSRGYKAISAAGDGEDLFDLIVQSRPNGALVYPRGWYARIDIKKRLGEHGITVEEIVVYDQPEQRPNEEALLLLEEQRSVLLPLFSPRTAEIAARWASNAAADVTAACMSDAIAEAWGAESVVSTQPNVGSMVDAVAEILVR